MPNFCQLGCFWVAPVDPTDPARIFCGKFILPKWILKSKSEWSCKSEKLSDYVAEHCDLTRKNGFLGPPHPSGLGRFFLKYNTDLQTKLQQHVLSFSLGSVTSDGGVYVSLSLIATLSMGQKTHSHCHFYDFITLLTADMTKKDREKPKKAKNIKNLYLCH